MGNIIRYKIEENEVSIINSYQITVRKEMNTILNYLRSQEESNVWLRTNRSLIQEWVGHNNLYKLHICRSHTRTVDFEYPQPLYLKLIWFLLSIIRL